MLMALLVIWIKNPLLLEPRPPEGKTWVEMEFDGGVFQVPERATRIIRVRNGTEMEPISGGLPYPPEDAPPVGGIPAPDDADGPPPPAE